MLKALTLASIVAFAAPAFAQVNYGTSSNLNSHYVQGHINGNGTIIQPHYQTNPNSSTHDNYGALGNYNPHNGMFGRGY